MDTALASAPVLRKPAAYKSDIKPIWCLGCGDFGVLAAFTRAFAQLGLDPDKLAIVSGIGCSSRLPAYMSAYGFHGVHGRALALGTGLKQARPDLTVVVVGGDGDGFSIGGNHFLHACRCNVDILYLVMDNRVYGMTKGQPSPTTEEDWESTLSPEGPGVAPIEPMALALASGASFVARSFALDQNLLVEHIIAGMRHPGFAFVQALSPCVTFRPEEMEWKETMHPGPAQPYATRAEAFAAALADDPLSSGIYYREARTVLAPGAPPCRDLAAIERAFAL